MKPAEILLGGFTSPALSSQMVVVILRDDLVEDPEIATLDGGEQPLHECLVHYADRSPRSGDEPSGYPG